MYEITFNDVEVFTLLQACRNSVESLTEAIDGMSDEPTALIANPAIVKAAFSENIARYEQVAAKIEAAWEEYEDEK